ncbi:MAG: hypothetical protein MJE63_27485 [Proteobacteria bacterium]|nr:hypothetical protein [Pseudomonadota bacterium]
MLQKISNMFHSIKGKMFPSRGFYWENKEHTSDLLCLEYVEGESIVKSSGMAFKEFITCLPRLPSHILFINFVYTPLAKYPYHMKLLCPYCSKNDFDKLVDIDVYNFGDFAWIDFDSVESLDTLEPQEIAELYYLGRQWRPVNSTYFQKLNNRFVYTAHDDYHINHLLYRDMNDYKDILSNIIPLKLSKLYQLTLPPIDDDTISTLVELIKSKIAIDMEHMKKDERIAIPIYTVEADIALQNIWLELENNKLQASHELVYDSDWELVELS